MAFAMLLAAGPARSQPAAGPRPAPPALTLGEIIRQALARNSGFESARQAYPVARAQHQQARAGVLPTISAQAYHTKQTIPTSNIGPIADMFPGGLYAPEVNNQTVAISHQTVSYAAWNRLAASRHAVRASVQDVEKARIDLVASCKQAFYDMLLADELVRVQEETVAQNRRQLELTRAQVNVESAPRIDELRSEVQLANSEPQLLKARYDREIVRQRLANLMRIPGDTEFTVRGSFTPARPPARAADLLARALATRPDVRSARERVRGARKSVKAAIGGQLPTVTTKAAYQKAMGLLFPLNEELEVSSATVQVDLPVFDGLLNAGKVKEARAQERRACADLASLEQSVELEIRQALALANQSREILLATEKAVDQAARALEISKEGYQVGARTHLEMLDAQLALTTAQTNRASARHDYSVAVTQLEKALGTAPMPDDETAPGGNGRTVR